MTSATDTGTGEQVRRLLALAVGSLPTGSEREGQQRMALAVAETLREGGALLVQAGTGTGKSLGYLVPILAQRKRVVVATATKALQAQLVDDDLPRLVDALTPVLGRRPTFALAKGRHNYACLLRAHGEAEPDDGQEAIPVGLPGDPSVLGRQVVRLREWALSTESGDRDDVDFAVDDRAWGQVSISARDCIGTRCPYRTDCHSERAREQAREADIVVANHTLLTLDLAGGGRTTVDVEAIVIDEAHELADRATDALTEEITPTLMRRMTSAAAKQVATTTKDRLQAAADDMVVELSVLEPGHLPALGDTLAAALRNLATQAEGADKELAAEAKSAAAQGDDDPLVAGERDRARVLLQQVAGASARLGRGSHHDASYVAGGALRVAPLHVGSDLARTLFPDRAVVLTSATLAVGGSMDVAARGLGLAKGAWEGLDVGSPFAYEKQGMLYVAAHLPDPGREAVRWAAAVDSHLVELIRAAGGRTLALFSSMAAARRAAAVCREQLDVPILLQGEDTAPVLRHRFAADVRACLFGVRTFWQGVDVAGSACQLVVVDRIPFPHVNDPLVKARTLEASEAGRNGFVEVSVPAAAVLLAQGVGRLIRSTEDRGVVAVLDSRLATKQYGGLLRSTLPPLWSTRDPAVALAALARLDASAPPPRLAGPSPAERRRANRAGSGSSATA